MPQVRKIDIKTVNNNCKQIASRYKHKKLDYIIGVATGGIIPAYMVAQRLKSEDRYINLRPNRPMPRELENSDCVLVIDDLSDTGATKEKLLKELSEIGVQKVYFEVAYTKPNPKEWAVFSWESTQDEVGEYQTSN